MSKYNVYKVKNDKVAELRTHLLNDRNYRLTGSYTSGGYTISVLFSEAQPTEIWWLKQYEEHFGEYAGTENEVYSGAIFAKKTEGDTAYVIPLGKTHFYIQDFVEVSFGLELAERIADDNQTKMKSLKSFGGKTSKSLVSYNSGASLAFDSCESAEYLKLKAGDKDKWGNSFIHFGSSVQFNSSEVDPGELGVMLTDIDTALAQNSRFNLPLMKEVDKNQSVQLYLKLSQKIHELDETINFLDFEVYGVDFVFAQQTHVKLKYTHNYSDPLTELSLNQITTFATENNIDLTETLSKIKVQILVDGDSKYTVQLIKLLEYYDDETRCFLFRGKWFHFNESFITSLHRALANIEVQRFPMTFAEIEYQTWKAAQTEGVKYRERFILIKINETLDFPILDRDLDYQNTANKTYSIEIGDLHDVENEKIIVVKIGEPRDFSYAFDQSFAVLSNIEGHQYKTADGSLISIKELEVLLIFKTERELQEATDTNSIIFELKLNELQKLARDKNVRLKLSYSNVT